MTRSRGWMFLLVAVGLGGCTCRSASPAVVNGETKPVVAAPAPVAVPAAVPVAAKCVPKRLVAKHGTPKIDGELDEPVWHSAAATEPFIHEKVNRVVPHTEARAAWDAQALYLVLYVADADLTSTDQVKVDFEGIGSLVVNPAGALTCELGDSGGCSGVVARVERDGDVDANKEEDEEWAAELKVPWSRLSLRGPPARLPIGFSRQETLEGKPLKEVWSRGCGELVLEGAEDAGAR